MTASECHGLIRYLPIQGTTGTPAEQPGHPARLMAVTAVRQQRHGLTATLVGVALLLSSCSSSGTPSGATRFIGHWYVHGETVDIQSSTRGLERSACGGSCLESDSPDLRYIASGA